jgi:2-ketocyclohexanecarboxyl-CoA hydrolase
VRGSRVIGQFNLQEIQMNYTDVLYEVSEGIATITINRPDRLNCFRGRTIEELIHAFKSAWADKTAGCVILTASGNKAF